MRVPDWPLPGLTGDRGIIDESDGSATFLPSSYAATPPTATGTASCSYRGIPSSRLHDDSRGIPDSLHLSVHRLDRRCLCQHFTTSLSSLRSCTVEVIS